MAINTLVGVARSAKAPPSARVAAASALIDRGWGRAPVAITGEDGGPIRVIIRQIIDNVEENDTKLIEQAQDEDDPATG